MKSELLVVYMSTLLGTGIYFKLPLQEVFSVPEISLDSVGDSGELRWLN